jgi:formamidopyrimidine-DNA glycosylase
MPELPDVETVRRMLQRTIGGRRIGRVTVLSPSTVRSPASRRFERRLRGRRIHAIDRRGKYLLIGLEGVLTLVVHLRMTGDFEIAPRTVARDPHTRVVFSFDGKELRFVDQRRFGHMDLVPTAELQAWGLARLGAEPLDRQFTLDQFRRILRGRRGGLKALLLRQDLIAGIGNIYADAILFQARLQPARALGSLRPADIARLHQSIRTVLRRATIGLSRYGKPVGEVGEFLRARESGGRCPRCGRPLTVSRVAGRTTYWCRACQR